MACETESYDGSCGDCGCPPVRPVPVNGTPAALAPIAREVLGWVANHRDRLAKWDAVFGASEHVDTEKASEALQERRDMIRKIELCALATLDVGMLHDLYCIGPGRGLNDLGGGPSGKTADPQE